MDRLALCILPFMASGAQVFKELAATARSLTRRAGSNATLAEHLAGDLAVAKAVETEGDAAADARACAVLTELTVTRCTVNGVFTTDNVIAIDASSAFPVFD